MRPIPHDLAAQRRWDLVKVQMGERGADFSEFKTFYELGADCLWVTTHEGQLWWAFAKPEVTWLGGDGKDHGTCGRVTTSGWHNADVAGGRLLLRGLSSRLTHTFQQRRTICRVHAEDYLVRRINCVPEPVVARAAAIRAELIAVAGDMLQALDESDFETLVDVIFARGGWSRVSRVGGTQADIDMAFEQLVSGASAFVQVKSKADQSVLDDYTRRFRQTSFQRMYFVCHSPQGVLQTYDDDRIHVWLKDRIAEMAVSAGLYDWLVKRSS